jgi:hypothetical protein
MDVMMPTMDGFRGLGDLEARQEGFRRRFSQVTAFGAGTADLVIEAATTLLDTRPPKASAWRHADLLNAPHLRPYQYEAYAVFRASGYQGHLSISGRGSPLGI